jgi:NADH dehydrogenase
MTILVVGAGGTLGRATTRQLLSQGHAVRALVRDRAKAEPLRRLGAEVVTGDLTDPPSLARACKGATRVFACAHGLLGRGAQSSAQVDHVGHSALVVAAREAHVEHFVYTSALGAADDHPIDFFRTKHEIEAVVQGSGLGWTILRPAAFMEQHVHEFNGRLLLEKGFTVLIGPANRPRNVVAVRDVVPFAVLALTEDGLAGRTLEIGGPDNVSNTQVAQMYAVRAHLPRGRIRHLPAGVARALAGALRPLHEGIARVIDIALLDTDQSWSAAALRAEFDIRLTGVEDFIDERVAAWRRSARR